MGCPTLWLIKLALVHELCIRTGVMHCSILLDLPARLCATRTVDQDRVCARKQRGGVSVTHKGYWLNLGVMCTVQYSICRSGTRAHVLERSPVLHLSESLGPWSESTDALRLVSVETVHT